MHAHSLTAVNSAAVNTAVSHSNVVVKENLSNNASNSDDDYAEDAAVVDADDDETKKRMHDILALKEELSTFALTSVWQSHYATPLH
jgi:hypothetical protein